MKPADRKLFDAKQCTDAWLKDCKATLQDFSTLENTVIKDITTWKTLKKTNKWMPAERLGTCEASLSKMQASLIYAHTHTLAHVIAVYVSNECARTIAHVM